MITGRVERKLYGSVVSGQTLFCLLTLTAPSSTRENTSADLCPFFVPSTSHRVKHTDLHTRNMLSRVFCLGWIYQVRMERFQWSEFLIVWFSPWCLLEVQVSFPQTTLTRALLLFVFSRYSPLLVEGSYISFSIDIMQLYSNPFLRWVILKRLCFVHSDPA
jgi:hypothetical protein